MGRLGGTSKSKKQDESDTGDNDKVEGEVQKLLVFSEKNLNKIEDKKTCKKKTMKGKLGKDIVTNSMFKVNKSKLGKVRQSKVQKKQNNLFQVNCVRFCFRDWIHKKIFVQHPWLNVKAAVRRYS